MSSCRKRPLQKVIIPKGMIDPNETTIIEIPEGLHEQPVVIASKKNASFEVTTSGTALAANQNYMEQSPQDSMDMKLRAPSSNGNQKCTTIADLERTEQLERQTLQEDLEDFQRARRKLLLNTSMLAGGSNACPGASKRSSNE